MQIYMAHDVLPRTSRAQRRAAPLVVLNERQVAEARAFDT
jgi:hypothetical protein